MTQSVRSRRLLESWIGGIIRCRSRSPRKTHGDRCVTRHAFWKGRSIIDLTMHCTADFIIGAGKVSWTYETVVPCINLMFVCSALLEDDRLHDSISRSFWLQ